MKISFNKSLGAFVLITFGFAALGLIVTFLTMRSLSPMDDQVALIDQIAHERIAANVPNAHITKMRGQSQITKTGDELSGYYTYYSIDPDGGKLKWRAFWKIKNGGAVVTSVERRE